MLYFESSSVHVSISFSLTFHFLVYKVYAPLEDDQRFLGKEIVGMIANRFGKSCSALVLAMTTMIFPTFFIVAPYLLSGLCFIWLLIPVSILLLVVQLLLLSSSKQHHMDKETIAYDKKLRCHYKKMQDYLFLYIWKNL